MEVIQEPRRGVLRSDFVFSRIPSILLPGILQTVEVQPNLVEGDAWIQKRAC